MNETKIVVNEMPIIREYCPFAYDKTERREPVWCRDGYCISVEYCGFTNEHCTLAEEDGGCQHLISIKDIINKI